MKVEYKTTVPIRVDLNEFELQTAVAEYVRKQIPSLMVDENRVGVRHNDWDDNPPAWVELGMKGIDDKK